MSASPPLGPLFWRQLLSLLDERRVVPIVGVDATVVEGEDGPRPLAEYLARRVERLLELDPASGPAPTLNEVACRYLVRAGAHQLADIYWAVKQATVDFPVEPPPALRRMARIRAFDLYVTTTFDDLLQRAIDAERFGGSKRTRSYAYSPENMEDLPDPLAALGGPVVYYLLGRARSVPEYAVTDEDILEFVHSLQSPDRRPELLLDELGKRSLLIIGSGYSDWLARFFLRVARRERLLHARSTTDVVAELPRGGDTHFRSFLQHFSAQTRLFTGGALAFIDELADRWEEHAGSVAGEPEPEAARTGSELIEHAIFVSYASEDREAAASLAQALEQARLPVWFDRGGGLQGGDDYERKIRRQIEMSSVFVPVLSPNVLTRQRRFFKFEWSIAGEVARRASETLPFVVPVCVADLSPDAAELPDHIRRAHWLQGGEAALAEWVQRLRDIYREYHLALPGSA